MINKFLQYLQYEKNYSSHTVLSYHNDLKQFCEFHNFPLTQFSPELINSLQIQQWMLELMSLKISPRSISRKISTLKSFWHFLIKNNYTNQNPTLKIILPKTKKPLPAFFKHNEIITVLENSFIPDQFEKIRNNLIIETFYSTGIRLSELISIQLGDVDLVGGNLKVIGKRNKQRVIPISKTLSKKIGNYIEVRNKATNQLEPYLFLRTNGKKMYPKLVYTIVHDTMSQVSSLHKQSPHVLRHSFATNMLNGGADINAIKNLLGHSNLAATQVYTHTSFEELNTIYKHAHPRAK